METNQVRSWLEEHREEFVRDMMDFFRIKSVSEPQEGEFPFGPGCKKMLDLALERSASYGLDPVNHENYCGSALLYGESREEIGVFAHVDVVEEGEGWQTPPYEPVIKDGWIYARGSSDNKGPAVAALYALRYLKEQKVPLKHTIRLYYGCSEEHGMEDILYYREHYPLPAFSFVPDASFAVCYAEKGILEGQFSRKLQGNLLSFCAGHAPNAVPGTAEALLRGDCRKAETYFKDKPDFHVENLGEQIRIQAEGKTAHAAFPDGADSAAVKLAKELCESGLLDQESQECLGFVWKAFESFDGSGMGIAYREELSGPLTLVGGTVRTQDGKLEQTINIRYPAGVDQNWMIQSIQNTAASFGWQQDTMHNNESYQIDPSDPKIQRMIEICSQVWGRKFEPYAMGGGTYARKLKNAVAYGPGILDQKKPGWPDHGKGHQPDECVCIENMMKAAEIYARALMDLDQMLEV